MKRLLSLCALSALFVATPHRPAVASCVAPVACSAIRVRETLELIEVVALSVDPGDTPTFLEADAVLVFDGSGDPRRVEFLDREVQFVGGR